MATGLWGFNQAIFKELNLAGNEFTSLPEQLHVLQNLRKLDISHNKVSPLRSRGLWTLADGVSFS